MGEYWPAQIPHWYGKILLQGIIKCVINAYITHYIIDGYMYTGMWYTSMSTHFLMYDDMMYASQVYHRSGNFRVKNISSVKFSSCLMFVAQANGQKWNTTKNLTRFLLKNRLFFAVCPHCTSTYAFFMDFTVLSLTRSLASSNNAVLFRLCRAYFAMSQHYEELSFTYRPCFPACRVTSSRTPLFALAIAREGMLADSEPRGSDSPWTGFMYCRTR